jgi:predicted HNH restriction endonuclease
LPGRRLWAALDAHHIVPLAVRQSEPDGSMITNVDELITLCATCHRLVHASADLSWTRLAEDWTKVGREPPSGRLAQKR